MLNIDKLYWACNKYHWCTHATTATYDKILKMPEMGFETKEIAWSVYLVSNAEYLDILDKLKALSRRR